MATFEIPTIITDRLRLRAFQASDLDAYAAMQANPEVMRYLVTGRTSTRAEVWRTMATSLGAWALRGYGMWACEKIGDDVFIGSVGVFEPLDCRNRRSLIRSTSPSGDRVSRPKPPRLRAIGCLHIFSCPGLRASFDPITTRPNASRNGSTRSANGHSSCAVPPMNIGSIAEPRPTPNRPVQPATNPTFEPGDPPARLRYHSLLAVCDGRVVGHPLRSCLPGNPEALPVTRAAGGGPGSTAICNSDAKARTGVRHLVARVYLSRAAEGIPVICKEPHRDPS